MADEKRGSRMIFRLILFVWAFVLDLAAVSRLAEDEKDLEIMLLRQQLRIAERKQPRGPHLPRWQKVPLVALAMQLKGKTTHGREKLEESVLLFKPDTVLGWHRAIVRWNTGVVRLTLKPSLRSSFSACHSPIRGYPALPGESTAPTQPRLEAVLPSVSAETSTYAERVLDTSRSPWLVEQPHAFLQNARVTSFLLQAEN